MALFLLWDLKYVAPYHHVKRAEDIVSDYQKDEISEFEYRKRQDHLKKEVVDVLGQPQRGRPDDMSSLSTYEQYARKHYPKEYMERWGKLWRYWEKDGITCTRDFWEQWGKDVYDMWLEQPHTTSSEDDQGTSDNESQFKIMQKNLDETQGYVSVEVAKVTGMLKSDLPLSEHIRHQMAQTLSRAQDMLSRGCKKIGNGIAALSKKISEAKTKGYKTIQENFYLLKEQISQLSVLQDLAVKAYSKGLINAEGKNEAFVTGILSPGEKANSFLELIRMRIKGDQKAYDVFLDILRSEPAYEHLVPLAGGT